MTYMSRYRLIHTVLLTALLAGGSIHAMAGVVIHGNVYGGGNLADVKTNTEVNICAKDDGSGTYEAVEGEVTIEGNVFGGGKGKADNFTCDKAMVGVVDDGVTDNGESANPRYTLKDGGTTVRIFNGTVEGDVYGGGQVGRVERNTIVTIGKAGNTTLTPTVKGQVFGAGKGEETHGYSALVRGNSTVTIQGKAEVWQNVHGGGEKASVGRYQVATTQALADQYHVAMGMPCYLKAGGKCTVNIQDQATIGKDNTEDSGDVYGAGQGVRPTYAYSEYSTYVDRINNNSKRMVNHVDYDSTTGTGHNPDSNHKGKTWDYYVDEETNEEDTRYVWEYFPTKDAFLLYVETLGRASETDVVIGGKRETAGESAGSITTSSNAPTVKGTVYGGSESGFVYYSTTVNIKKGQINGDVFGGGKGLETFSEAGRVRINTNLTINDGTINGNVYGGGSLGDVGYISKNFTNYNYQWKKSDGSNSFNTSHNNTITGTNTNTGICNVTISGGTIGTGVGISSDGTFANGNVYGAGKGLENTFWCEKAMVFATNVSITAGTVNGTVYGGGKVGRVEDDAKVTIGGGASGPAISGNVFGAGAGIKTHGYSALLRGNTDVTVQGNAQIGLSVYGGGETASVGRFNLDSKKLPKDPLSGGTCKVTVNGNAQIGTSGTDHNVFGACKGVEPDPSFTGNYNKAFKCMKTFATTPERDTSGDHPSWEYYPSDHTYVWEYFANEAAYLEFLRTLALTSNTDVEINGSASVNGSVYGGGESGITLGKVEVDIISGTVTQDVYGGGALADTNTANWENNALVPTYPYHKEASISRPSYVEIEVDEGASVEGKYTKSGDNYVAASGTANGGTQYYEKLPGASTTGLYTRTGSEGNYSYTKITSPTATADETTDYFALYTTTVNLFGGAIGGNVYGGGLGRFESGEGSSSKSLVEAKVYGETKVNLNGLTVGERNAAPNSIQNLLATTAIDGNGDNDITDADDDYHVVSSKGCVVNQIFGCNNQKGSPQGNVTVQKDIHAKEIVLATALSINTDSYQINESSTEAQVKTAINNVIEAINAKTSAELNAVKYDVKAVYGGGNEAAYVPATPYHPTSAATGSKVQVIIEGCEYTSIETVYGGGNAASVPEANIAIKAAYEIGTVFGGGNGKEPTPHFNPNPGADIGTYKNASNVDVTYGTGNANTLITGGYIHEAYGGSNEKGTIIGSVNLTSNAGTACAMLVKKMVTAGKNADILGDAITVLGCMPDSWVEEYYGGADNANVHGDVELTITSGNFRKVFGGNNRGGIIMGHIKVNIEETGCIPINIDELYLGGNQAAYSTYGYYVTNESTAATDGKYTFEPRTSETDTHPAVMSFNGITGLTTSDTFKKYSQQPELNIISCTHIGKVFGGGLGTGAIMYGNPTVNINMIAGNHAATSVPAKMTALSLPSTENTENLGIIGTVYGGGNAADVVGDPTVNIGTVSTVTLVSTRNTQNVVGAYITGNVYGGGKGEADNFLCNKAMIGADGAGLLDADGDGKLDKDGGPTVQIFKGFVRGNVYGGGQIGRVEKNTVVTIGTGDGVAPGGTPTSAPIILGSVYGGGAGEEEHGYAALVRGNPTVTIQGNAKVRHSVYGGGEIASVARYNVPKTEGEVQQAIAEGYTEAALGMPYALKDASSGTCTVIVRGYAEIGPETAMQMTKAGGPDDTGYVFGAGKGILPGGDYEYANGTTRRMVLYDATVHTTVGQEGSKWQWVDPAHSDTNKNVWEYFDNLDEYIRFIQTLALSSRTYVTITDNAFVKGSVYGGSENGIVQFNTNVTIQGGQIGAGAGMNEPYAETDWAGTTTPTNGWKECASWLFQEPYAPYDPYATNLYNGQYYYDSNHTQEAAGGASVATDGHTYYGNVFGGGSGCVPYFDHTLGRSVYLHSAGQVKGDTHVTISGGHILTNVYGGCEATNVEGSANVTMTDGTIGVPRTDTQIIAHPLTGYIFGGGKGDQRIFFNKDTNVKDAVVTVEGGRIYGSVYGGGEDGHVMRNVTLTIGKQTQTTGANDQVVTTTSGPTIGTEGTSYYDGHVFGGGRGFGGDALTAGNVGGSVDVNIIDGNILGSVYGGGRLASVGYGLYLVDEEVTIGGETVKPYGTMRPDNVYDNPSKPTSTETAAAFFNKGRGHINMTISGGTIGNDNEYAYDANNQLSHTKGGNVFAGGMGRMYKLDGTTPISSLDWWKLGCVKSTKLTISGDAKIYSCVYGGGELGQVVGYHTAKNAANQDVNVGTEVNINSGTIGTKVVDGSNVVQYTFGSVFGGGYGSLEEIIKVQRGTTITSYPKYIAGRVKAGTKVNMTAGSVLASVYGGGEMAAVGESKTLGETLTTVHSGDTYVSVSGGTVGIAPITISGSNRRYFGGAKMGNVYGGGSGHGNTVRSGHVYGNTNVTISAGSVSGEPNIYHNVYGGGAYGSVGDFTYQTGTDAQTGTQKVTGISDLNKEHPNSGNARVTITGGTIGYDGKENGMVFGSSRGDINKPGERDDHTAWVYDTHVTIGTAGTPAQGTEGEEGYVAAVPASGPNIKGSVYGSGENGHTFKNTVVTVNGGTIGIDDNSDPGYSVTSNGKTYEGAAYPYRGNVYGGGCGTDKYYSNHSLENHSGEGDYYNALAGIVYGTTTVNIYDGKVVRNVYGAGAMGSVGKTTWTTTTTTVNNVETTTKTAAKTEGGTTKVNIYGGTIGTSGTDGNGNVFGAARGAKDIVQADQDDLSKVSITNVKVSGGKIKGNVYGGGELGDVGTIVKNTDYNYTWMESGNSGPNTPENNTIVENNINTGICNVTITGGTIGSTNGSTTVGGNVFGGGKGDANTWWCEKAMAFATSVSISGSQTKVNGTVYGGGEIGRVEDDTKVIIGTENGSDTPEIGGNVFGAGKGLATRGYSALVRGNSIVTIQGSAQVKGNVFGGGEEASLGRFVLDNGLPKSPLNGGYSSVTIQDGANIGSSSTGRNVYGAGQGVTPNYDEANYKNFKSMQLYDNRPKGAKDIKSTYWDYYKDDDENEDRRFVWVYYKSEPEYLAFLNTLALASYPTVTIAENATISGSVFGGGQRGITLGNVAVNINGGTVAQDVYGGGALADTNKGNWEDSQYSAVTLPEGHTLTDLYTRTGGSGTAEDPYTYAEATSSTGADANTTYYSKGTWATGKYDNSTHATFYKTNVILTGGEIEGDVYGGGLGQIAREAVAAQPALSAVKAKVYGDVLVKLNEDTDNDDCKVHGNIFGCNNQNGSPQSAVTVHVYKTEGWEGHMRTGKELTGNTLSAALNDPVDSNHSYELKGVYGGGNLSAFYPDLKATRDTVQAYVIIDGCDLTSIQTVYGGGNAASVPASNVTINATYEIEEVFGGGNGKEDVSYDGGTTYVTNPGANVGYEEYPTAYDIPESSKTERTAKFSYGSGKANVTIYDGLIHRVFGGSNTKGNVRESAVTLLDDMSGCHFQVDEAYGGGKNAPMDAEATLLMACIPGLKVAYGGAENADVLGGVNLTITNGTYERIFGGNNISGTIQGPIVVNIEETGCRPIIIGELYGGGNKAGYSVYGYDGRTPIEPGENVTKQYNDPVVNVKSFTSIGNIFGGGFGASAKMIGDPTVNINVVKGKYADTYNGSDNEIGDNARIIGSSWTTVTSAAGYDNGYPIPSHVKGAIGAINNVFGGGNEAEVKGTPHVNIGTMMGEPTTLVSKKIEDSEGHAPSDAEWTPSYAIMTVEGADIRGNVYGGGNNAPVTGNTDVQIGKNNVIKTYSFTSYSAESGGTAYSTGLAQTTGEVKKVSDTEYAEVVILTNGSHGEFVGQKFYVSPTVTQDGSTRTQLKKDVNGSLTDTGIYVAIKPFEKKKTYSFTSYSAASGGTEYSTGTAAPTGNFKTLNSKECMQIVVLTNPGEASWVGKTFYVPIADATRRQLYKADGTEIDVWVEITE